MHVHVPDRSTRRRRLAPSIGALAASAALSLGAVALTSGPAGAFGHHHSGAFGHHHSFLAGLSGPTEVGTTTVPSNGDENPYGITTVPRTIGNLVAGNTLISNFNANTNLQGTGTTIDQITPSGTVTTFAQIDPSTVPNCTGGVGLTTALATLPHGFVVVGSLPVTNAGQGTPEAGCLIVLNSTGTPVETWTTDINGPWDMTARSFGPFSELFVTNVLNGTVAGAGAVVPDGTIVRLDVVTRGDDLPKVRSTTVIGGGFDEQLNSGAVVLGPTGVALGHGDVLYVADTVNSRIAAIPHASSRFNTFPVAGGRTVTSGGGLVSPLGLVATPNGNLVAVNAGNGNATEVTPWGHQIDVRTIDPLNNSGDLFGLTLTPSGDGILFVDDGNNTLWQLGS